MCIELARRRVDAVQLFDRIGGATDVTNLPVNLSFDVSNMEKHILNEKELRIIGMIDIGDFFARKGNDNYSCILLMFLNCTLFLKVIRALEMCSKYRSRAYKAPAFY